MKSGITPPVSDRGAALLSIPNELGCSLQTVLALVAMVMSTLKQIHSPDAFAIAMMDAADYARDAGVPAQEWERVQKIVMSRWSAEHRRNPISSMF